MKKNITVVTDLFSGDCGKARVLDYIVSKYDEENLVIRFNGSLNSGHTVVLKDKGKIIFHQVPAGILNKHSTNLMGAGTFVNPEEFLKEYKEIEERCQSIGSVYISERSHVVLPFYKEIDALEEEKRVGKDVIGTTKRGVGPTALAKYNRIGIRFGDLYHNDLCSKVKKNLDYFNIFLSSNGKRKISYDEIMDYLFKYGADISRHVIDDYHLVQDFMKRDRPITLEAQLGIFKDVNFGCYPIVTSSSVNGYSSGAGINPMRIGRIVGVMKAYSTSVGGGPFPTEVFGGDADNLVKIGGEYGSTTGRRRRVGWVDLLACRYGADLSSSTELAITKLDVLDSFEKILLCKRYTDRGGVIKDVMPNPSYLDEYSANYEEMNGWCSDTTNLKSFDELPLPAKKYVYEISSFIDRPVTMVSVGPERNQILL